MDTKTLLQSLLGHKVRFVLIGAWALPAYGGERMTRDIGIFISPTISNVRRTKRALQAVGYDIVEEVPDGVFLEKKVLLRDYLRKRSSTRLLKVWNLQKFGDHEGRQR